jgi:prevent-host-death family protein
MPIHVVNTHEAKSRLSELIREAQEGVEVIVARNGHPVARIVPWESSQPSRVPGAWAGRVAYEGDIVGPDDDIAALFEESAQADPA